MRQIVLDTETTGLSTEKGHRIIEIAAVEIIDQTITDNHFQCYINPERPVDPGALAIHGLSNEFLSDKPKFSDVMHDFLNFVGSDELIIHNAPFDVGFIDYEFSLLGHLKSITEYCPVFDTLKFARQLHPGLKNSLDALCKRYKVDNSHRHYHGALLDALLLAELYRSMTGGQVVLFSETEKRHQEKSTEAALQLVRAKPLPVTSLTNEENEAHLQFVEFIKSSSGSNLWEDE